MDGTRCRNNRRIVRNILINDTIGADAHIIPDRDIADDLRARADVAIVPDPGRAKALGSGDGDGAYRDLLEDHAIFADLRLTGYENPVDTVWETGLAGKSRIKCDAAAI